jgi:hypothetical protein
MRAVNHRRSRPCFTYPSRFSKSDVPHTSAINEPLHRRMPVGQRPVQATRPTPSPPTGITAGSSRQSHGAGDETDNRSTLNHQVKPGPKQIPLCSSMLSPGSRAYNDQVKRQPVHCRPNCRPTSPHSGRHRRPCTRFGRHRRLHSHAGVLP